MTDDNVGLKSGIPAVGEDSSATLGLGTRTGEMNWEGFFTNYKRPGFIPGYEIVNKLGSGVFGEVYKARKDSIGKFYAIKFLKITDERISEQIFKELDSLAHFAQLDHPNLVTIEDRGEVMGIPYVVMGYAGDETLKKRLETAGCLDREAALDIFRQVCAGVAALHEKSIIHFDLKPANIFLKGSHARVGDYGLSKLVSESHKSMSMGRGTPYYMAPEMLLKHGDHRSDIYSLGIILYQIVTGKLPFVGDNDWAVLKKHEAEEVEIPASVDPLLRHVMTRCLEKRPENRFQSVREILSEMDGRPRSAVMPQISTVIPPPLPTASQLSRSANKKLHKSRRGTIDERTLRLHVRDLIKRVIQSPRAEEAKYRYERVLEAQLHSPATSPSAPMRPDPDLGSFYTDFDHLEAEVSELGGDTPNEPAKFVSMPERPHQSTQTTTVVPPLKLEVPPPVSRGFLFYFFTSPYWLLYGLVWQPLKWSAIGLYQGLRLTFRGVAEFFRHFLKYVIVLALTVGIVFVIRVAILGLNR